MKLQGRISESEYQQFGLLAKAAAAENWLKHEGTANKDGTITYRGVTTEARNALLLAYVDARQYWDKNSRLSKTELTEAAKDFTKGAYDLWIGNDLKTLRDPNATSMQRAVAGGMLLLNVLPVAKVEGMAGRIVLGRLAEIAAKKEVQIGIGAAATAAAGTILHDNIYSEYANNQAAYRQWLARFATPNSKNDNEKECALLKSADMAICSAVWPYPFYKADYTVCRGTAETRYGECKTKGFSTTTLHLYKEDY